MRPVQVKEEESDDDDILEEPHEWSCEHRPIPVTGAFLLGEMRGDII